MSAAVLPPTPPNENAFPMATKGMTNMATAHAPSNAAIPPPSSEHQHIWIITGPAGCGKTSVAEHLHQTYKMPYLEGDTYHTPANVAKMARGEPLTDADRWDWLILLRDEAIKTLKQQPQPSHPALQNHTTTAPTGVILTCSALKRKYRDILRLASLKNPSIHVHFIFLRASEALLMDRVRARKNHYMKDYMVRSQFESLEAPAEDETDVLGVEAGGSSEEVKALAADTVEGVMREDA
ncbi:thermoresistant gluconokinase like protein [Venturia nashicola]|nr:thermoresistant gluconokinase like protein [Venturia nashicola]